MVDLDPPSFPDDQLCTHSVVVSCLILLIRIEIGVVASLDPHVEPCVVSPASSHQVSCCQVLLGLSFVHVKHEKEKFFRHLGDN